MDKMLNLCRKVKLSKKIELDVSAPVFFKFELEIINHIRIVL